MKGLFFLIASLFSLTCFAEGAYITGNSSVPPGTTATYYVSFDNWGGAYSYANISWSVTGGTILSEDRQAQSVTIEWDNNGGLYGTISVSEDLGGQWGDYYVAITGNPVPAIYPTDQLLDYGSTPGTINVSFDYPPSSVTYQWQEWQNATQTWSDITNATGSYYQPPMVTQSRRYRCVVNVNGTVYELESTITLTLLMPGSLQLTTIPTFNTSPSLTQLPATGGFCYSSSYAYSWEESIDGGPWTVFGNTAAVPSIAPLTGNIKIRRKVTCNGQELYTNTLDIDAAYASVDYENLTYIREITVNKKGIASWQQADQLTVGDKRQTTTYLDGLGRAVQNVSRESSVTAAGTWNDLVQHYEYDISGSKDFLPYSTNQSIGKFKSTAKADQQSYVTGFFSEPTGAPTYGQVLDDNSPLSRPVKVMAPGSSYGGNNVGVSLQHDLNYATEKVHIWDLPYSLSALPSTTPTQVYQNATLLKEVTTDEKGNQMITYTDQEGRQVLKKVQQDATANLSVEHSGWACTYYVYNDFGELAYVITPKAVEWLDGHGWNLTQAIADELCYHYVYDSRGQNVVRKQPGADEQYFVYDNKSRLVLTQTANQRQANNSSLSNDQWFFHVYDELNREISTGLLENNATRATIQGYVNNLSDNLVTISAFSGNGVYQSFTANSPVAGSTSSANYLSGNTNITFNSISFYDDYTYSGAKSFNNTYSFYNNSDPSAEPINTTARLWGFITGEKVRVIDNDNNPLNDKFLTTTAYYDEKGDLVETLLDNHKGGIDYQTMQHDFAGKVLSIYSSHNISGGSTYTTISRNVYDKIGRLKETYRNYNNSFYKELAAYNFDELGQVKSKRIAPAGASELEIQSYSYNINGQLTGINKDYALSNNNYSQWDHYFSEYLGYDNRDNAFQDAQYNGKITGVIWRTQGGNTPMKFDYTYDRMGRLTSGLFKQKSNPASLSWSNSAVDFSVYLQYEDGNGNIKSMKQMGIVPGTTGGVTVDDLTYTYRDVTGVTGLKGNMLSRVDDQGTLGGNNGLLGDFKDQASTAQEYTYDHEGNLVMDLNKNIQASGGGNGITYNYLGKPVKVVINNKSQVEYVYDASGDKLSQKVTVFPTTANGNQTTVTTTDYIGNFVYESVTVNGTAVPNHTDKLLFILNEEGRLKMITPVSTANVELSAPGGVVFSTTQHGVFEFFIKDHAGNTRMLLTEETQKEYYRASMDASAASVEEPIFGSTDANGAPLTSNELANTRTLSGTNLWPYHSSDYVKLTAAQANKRIGPNVMLKVMAGDNIYTTAKYFYVHNDPAGTNDDPVQNVATSLLGALISPGKGSAVGKAYSSSIQSNVYANMGGFINTTLPSTGNTSAPKAFINIVFLDEQFNFIDMDVNNPGVGTYSMRVSQNNVDAQFPTIMQKAPKNGWVFVYLSNESNEPVYFDDFFVEQEHGKIAKENHYYPFGLKMAGITSQAFNKLDTKYGYQGDYSEDADETGWNEFELRNYDPQIGRWTSEDPYDLMASSFVGMNNDPVNFVDPNGGIGINLGNLGSFTGSVWGDRLVATAVGTFGGYIIDKMLGGKGRTGAIIGGAVFFGGTFIPPFDISNIFHHVEESALIQRTTRIAMETVRPIIRTVITPPPPPPLRTIVRNPPPPMPPPVRPAPPPQPNQPPPPNNNDQRHNVNELTSSNEGIRFLVHNEGVILHPYNDSRGYATVGIGHLIGLRGVTAQDRRDWAWLHTREQAAELLRQDLANTYEPAIRRLVHVPLTQAQFDAIVSFTYNVGIGSLRHGTGLAGSNFLRALNAGRYDGNLMLRFRRPPEIIERRTREVNLFNTGAYH